MSELKSYTIYEGDVGNYTEHVVYSKSEADEVIADLKETHKNDVEQLLIEIAELKKQVHDYAQGLYVIQAKAEKEARHQKYKRCLAMTRWCKDNADWWNYEQINRLHEQRGNAESFRFKAAHNRFCFFAKWNERWLELAERFKED